MTGSNQQSLLVCAKCGNDTFIDVHVIETRGKEITFVDRLACEKCKARVEPSRG